MVRRRIALVQESPATIDLIILDLMLPGMSGYAVCEAIRNAGHTVPILMFAHRTLVEDRDSRFRRRHGFYLQKPFDLEELMSMVRICWRESIPRPDAGGRSSKPIDSGLRFGREMVNFDTYQVAVDESRYG